MKIERPAYTALLQVRAPRFFADALDKAASDHMMSRSDFIRLTLSERLKADALDRSGAAA